MTDHRLTVPEVMGIIRCQYEATRRLMASGAIASTKVGGKWTTTQECVDAYLDSQLVGTAPKQQSRRRRRRAS